MQISSSRFIFLTIFLAIAVTACSNPQPGPDKTIGGAVLGAGWGAGAGAVVGNQVSASGEGAAVGAGFGAVGGALTGVGYDLNEDVMLEQEKTLASLRVETAANQQQMQNLLNKFDHAAAMAQSGGIYQVLFDVDATNLRGGAIADLEVIAEQIKTNPQATKIKVIGHSDDSGNPEYNTKLAEARARTVSAYLASRGIAFNQIEVTSFGSQRPITSNSTDVGRQLNRRVDVYVTH